MKSEMEIKMAKFIIKEVVTFCDEDKAINYVSKNGKIRLVKFDNEDYFEFKEWLEK